MRFFQKTKGAISIFLVIIMVPMITVTSFFVDASRVKLSQSVASSAGDLALNTVLTQYDQDLSDYYGLMGSAQNIDEFMATAEKYFEASLVSQGVETTDAHNYAQQILGMIGGAEEVADVLSIDVDNSTVSLAPMTNGSLTNPTLMKNQIVEFMKYRSPINASVDLFKSLTDIKDKVEVQPAETDMTDDKQTYYETENKLLEKAYEAYKDIRKYEESQMSKSVIEDIEKEMYSANAMYKTMHKKLVYDLYNTQDKSVFQKKTIQYNPNLGWNYSANSQADGNDIVDHIDEFLNAANRFKSSKENLDAVINEMPYDSNTVHNTQYWITGEKKINEGNKYQNYVNNANDMIKCINRFRNAADNASDDANDSRYTFPGMGNYGYNANNSYTVNDLRANANSIYDGLIGDAKNSNSSFNKFLDNMVNFSRSAINGGATLDANGTRSIAEVEKQIKGINESLNAYYTRVRDGIANSTKAVSDLKAMKKLIPQYKKDFENWKGSANNPILTKEKSPISETDRKEIEKIEAEDVMKDITEESVQMLIDRLEGIKELLKNVKAMMDACKYKGKKVLEIDTYEKFKSRAGLSNSRITYTKSELDAYAEETFRFDLSDNWILDRNNNQENRSLNPEKRIKIEDGNNPSLTYSTSTSDMKVYSWLINRFSSYNEDNYDKKGAEDAKKAFEDEAKEIENEEDETLLGEGNQNISDQANLPSKGGTAGVDSIQKSVDLKKVSAGTNDMFSALLTQLGGMAEGVRDNLYVTDYITSMFSYDTFENEILFDEAMKNKENINILKPDYSRYKPCITSTEPTVTANKTLTTQMINKDNNFAYGDELEYILYGGTNSANKAKAYGSIFLVRFAFNLAPVFQEYWGNGVVKSISTAISAATAGIIPEPLARMVICLGINAAESAMDLKCIKNGMGVKLLKNHKDKELFINISASGMSGVLSSEGSDSNHKAIGKDLPFFQYSDYMSIFLFIAMIGQDSCNKILMRTADVVQVNMQKITNQPEFLVEKSQVYYQINADIRVSPLMLGLPITADENGNLIDISSWNTFTYSASKGY